MQLLPGVITFESALIEGLERHQEAARPRHLLGIDQLLAATELASGDVVLHVSDHHRE